ncbi:hypothetical protein [Streptococcus parauberis]|uniref:hypothetical protein n=1 Tax=Streptococcus parauberis TaxID=1348 RepID=UPI0003196D50|nr:hypothetical protein [Streptococcus parauberis]QBX09963.1 hypothetical protein JavanS401_0004 [Streptococcus satellite phage Javan401]
MNYKQGFNKLLAIINDTDNQTLKFKAELIKDQINDNETIYRKRDLRSRMITKGGRQ